jgi:hypothetical protein
MTSRSTEVKHKLVNNLLFFRFISTLLASHKASLSLRIQEVGVVGRVACCMVCCPGVMFFAVYYTPLVSSAAIGEPEPLSFT